jgi:hypothetical protein
MATKKMAVKKMVAKKPAAAMKKASPMKQKARLDDAEMKAYIKKQGAAKDKQVATHKQGLKDADKKGYTNDQINLYKNIAGKGDYAMGGASVNFRTGQSKITDFDKKYHAGKNESMRDRVLTSDGKKQVSQAGMKGGRTDAFPSQDYLKQSNASRMGDRDLRKQFVNDSIRTQGRKEEHRNIGENYGRVARDYGLQTSEVGAKVKAAIKKKTSALKQTKPTEKKKSVEINPKDGLSRPTSPRSKGLPPAKMKKC